jgi:hypothetical protein
MTRPTLLRCLRLAAVAVLLAAVLFVQVETAVLSIWLWPLALMMPPSLLSSCTFFTDDFSTDRTGTDYSVRAGSFTVSGGVLSTSSANALLRCETAVTGGLTGVYCSVRFTPTSNSDAGRLVIAYSDDSNYWFAEVQSGASNGTLKLYQRSAGTNTQKGTTQTILGFNAAETATIELCYSGGSVVAFAAGPGTNNNAGVVATATITIAGTKCGIGTGSISSSAQFDDFLASVHDSDNATCGFCDLPCNFCTDKLPSSIEVTLPSNMYTGNNGAGSCISATCCTNQNSRTFILEMQEWTIDADATCSVGSTATTCFYEYHEEFCAAACGNSWYLQVFAYFTGSGELIVVSRTGSGFSGVLHTVQGSLTDIAFYTTLSASQVCDGGTFSVPYLRTCLCGGCDKCVTSSPSAVSVAL